MRMDTRDALDAGLPIGEAASRLGISIPALRKRIRRGSVHAVKVEGVWRVTLPAAASADRPPDTGRGQLDAELDTGRDMLIDELRARIDDLRGQVASLGRTNEYLAAANAEMVRRQVLPLGTTVPSGAEHDQDHGRDDHHGRDHGDRATQTPASTPARRGWLARLLGR